MFESFDRLKGNSRNFASGLVTLFQERKQNRMRDFVAMSGPLGVTHLVVFSQPEAATASSSAEAEGEAYVNLRISRLPRGPTLTFRVLRYSLARDILAASRRPKSPGKEFASEALVRPSPACCAAPVNFTSFSNQTDSSAHSQQLWWRRQTPQAHDNDVSKPLPLHQRPPGQWSYAARDVGVERASANLSLTHECRCTSPKLAASSSSPSTLRRAPSISATTS
jgi:hypothetical protein